MDEPVACCIIRVHSTSRARLTRPEVKVTASRSRCRRCSGGRGSAFGRGSASAAPNTLDMSTAPPPAHRFSPTATSVVSRSPISSISR